MAFGNRAKTDPITTTYTAEVYPLGTRYVQPADEVVAALHTNGTTALGLQGPRTWVFVRATVALAAYDCVLQNDVTVTKSRYNVRPCAEAGAASLRVMGVAQHAIAITNYGWIVCDGQVVVKGAAGITMGLFLDTHTTSGMVDDNTAAGTLIGLSLSITGTLPSGTAAAGLIGADIRLSQ